MDNQPWYVTVPAAVAGLYVSAVIFRSLTTKRCRANILLKNKTFIVTGGNSGIGRQTALELAKRHARVILACRDETKANRAIDFVKSKTKNGELVFKPLDLASFQSVRSFCDDILKNENVNVLINNAGIMNHPFQCTEDGIEMHMAVNHFSNFLLTNLLIPNLKANAPSRIVFVSSALHKLGVIDFDNLTGKQTNPYANSKLANVYFAKELSERLQGFDVDVLTAHPGMVDTDLSRYTISPLMWKLLYPLKLLLIKTPNQGCQTIVDCAISEQLEGDSGSYFGNCTREDWPEVSSCKETQRKLWNKSAEITGIQ